MKVIGILGAIDPYRHRRNELQLQTQRKAIKPIEDNSSGPPEDLSVHFFLLCTPQPMSALASLASPASPASPASLASPASPLRPLRPPQPLRPLRPLWPSSASPALQPLQPPLRLLWRLLWPPSPSPLLIFTRSQLPWTGPIYWTSAP
jgi:hypothetical protein